MFDFERLARYQSRRFVPEKVQFSDVKDVQSLYQKMLVRKIHSVTDLEQWLLDRSELDAALDQEGAILYIRMTCQTDDAFRAESYKHLIETIIPAVKPLEDQLNQKYLEAVAKFPLNEKRFSVYTRGIRAEVDIFVKENVPLQTDVELLSQEYQTICGSLTVLFDGQEQTLPEMAKFLYEPDRWVRERAWRATAQRRLQEQNKLDQLFDQMLCLRNKIARNAGCQNFCAYKFRSLQRFDYTPEDCKRYHKTVEQLVVPLWGSVLERRRRQMNLQDLRPWDTSVDALGRPPLTPFENVQTFIEGCQEVFNRVDAEFGRQFADMVHKGLLDLASRKGKAPGGYQNTLAEAREPFIFMNAVGLDTDVRTLLHEGGHAFHSLACRQESLCAYRHAPMEFNEVASMGMELLAGEHLAVFYKLDEEQRSREVHFEDAIFTLVWVATIDAFQHWIYENPGHHVLERKEAWLNIRRRFGADFVNWDGLEEEHGSLWQKQLHIFEVPFYYIEYGIAQLGALQLWLNAQKDWPLTVRQYKKGLSLGGSRPLPELFQEAGLCFDFSERTIAPLMTAVGKELKL
ncbi:MAG: hypothetical protein A2Z81_07230 [Omnitrophica WOR_2 bacterium GWA2_45_18]|nr:MAG: hypothetical protein A2Z81_07230 [Omnitrophica WOR_2 bacterium GWA2_45_18]